MMQWMLIAIINGGVLAAAAVLVARVIPARFRLAFHAALLVVAALAYVFFAARAGHGAGLAVELAGTVVFGGVALRGLRRGSAGLVALGWALHPLWDVVLHSTGALADYTPDAYVAICLGFDLLLAAAIWRGWAGLPRAAAPAPASAH